jgi:hypothetical protein
VLLQILVAGAQALFEAALVLGVLGFDLLETAAPRSDT